MAGLLIGLLALGRDQVALLSLYVIAGFIFAHWLTGQRPALRRASRKPLAAVRRLRIVPCSCHSNRASSQRPRTGRDIGYESAAAGSLHPVHFLQLVFADLYGAMRYNEHYWAPQSPFWDAAWGWPELYLSPNMGLLYGGALPLR